MNLQGGASDSTSEDEYSSENNCRDDSMDQTKNTVFNPMINFNFLLSFQYMLKINSTTLMWQATRYKAIMVLYIIESIVRLVI